VDRYAKSLDGVFPAVDVAGMDRTLKFLRAELGDKRFTAIWSCGAAMSLEQAADEGLSAEPVPDSM
jgi:hypothetical protein